MRPSLRPLVRGCEMNGCYDTRGVQLWARRLQKTAQGCLSHQCVLEQGRLAATMLLFNVP